MGSGIARYLVEPWLNMLERGLKDVKMAPVSIKDNKLSIHAHTIVPQLVQEQTNGPTRWARGALPRAMSLVVGRGCWSKSPKNQGVNLGAV